jgi:hypothetical protein
MVNLHQNEYRATDTQVLVDSFRCFTPDKSTLDLRVRKAPKLLAILSADVGMGLQRAHSRAETTVPLLPTRTDLRGPSVWDRQASMPVLQGNLLQDLRCRVGWLCGCSQCQGVISMLGGLTQIWNDQVTLSAARTHAGRILKELRMMPALTALSCCDGDLPTEKPLSHYWVPSSDGTRGNRWLAELPSRLACSRGGLPGAGDDQSGFVRCTHAQWRRSCRE